MLHHHVVPIKVYLAVFSGLMILLAATVAAAYFNLGIFNNIVMLSIALAKALLIVLFFMHVRYSSRLTWVFAGVGFLFLAILIGGTMHDYLTRGLFSTIVPTLGNLYDPLGH
jgi:cytochrome c oxidase subunit IV